MGKLLSTGRTTKLDIVRSNCKVLIYSANFIPFQYDSQIAPSRSPLTRQMHLGWGQTDKRIPVQSA